MKSERPTEATFLLDTSLHEMTIVHEGPDPHRHLLFAAPETMISHFRIVTFADCLCYVGDMGSFTFRRTLDMFRFFRERDQSGALSINPSYWDEKVEASDRDGVRSYSPRRARESIEACLGGCTDTVRAQVRDEILNFLDDGEHEVRRRLYDFESGDFRFTDFECSLKDHSYRFIWACYAIVWGIRQYDQRIAAVAA